MSRFGNLEFNEGLGARPAGSVQRDEAYYFSDAVRAFEEGRFEPALRAYAKVIEHNPQNAAAWSGQVRALIELDELREARLWADKALERFPEDAELLATKAVALGREGDETAAKAFSDASMTAHGELPYVWLARGDVLLSCRERSADYCFDKALALARDDWFITWLAARARFYHEQFMLALKLAQQALARDVGRAVLWLLQGQCQMKLGMIGAARGSFQHALEIDPHCREAERALAAAEHGSVGGFLSGWWRQLRGH